MIGIGTLGKISFEESSYQKEKNNADHQTLSYLDEEDHATASERKGADHSFGESITRVQNLTWLLAEIYASKSVHLSKVASKIPGTAMLLSITWRLGRFLENPEFRVRAWYEPIVKGLLAQRAGQEYRLIAPPLLKTDF